MGIDRYVHTQMIIIIILNTLYTLGHKIAVQRGQKAHSADPCLKTIILEVDIL